jgi:hypothetical protein
MVRRCWRWFRLRHRCDHHSPADESECDLQRRVKASKVHETVDHLVANGASKKDFAGVIRAVSIQTNPLSPELLNSCPAAPIFA